MAYLKNGNIDHPVKEISAALSTQLTYKTYHISLLRDSIMSCVLNFYCNLREKNHTRSNGNSKKRNFYMWNQYYYFFYLPKISVGSAFTTKI